MVNHVDKAKLPLRMRAKMAAARIGRDSRRLDTLVNLPKIETWRREKVPAGCPAFDDRTEMYDFLQETLIGDQPIDYVEFGVHRGASMAHWVDLNRHPESTFTGFDSFEGLPEDWKRFDGRMVKAHFDVSGDLPDIEDERVTFVRGWFQETLDGFLDGFKPTSQLVVHVDSDLYSSALYVLTRCNDLLVPGTIVVFDEFSSVLNEFAALHDYCAAYMRDYEVLASAWHYYGHLAIRMR